MLAATTACVALRALHSGSARTIFVRKHGDAAHPAPNPTGPWVSWSRPSLVSPPRRPSRLWGMRAIRFCSSCPLRRLRSCGFAVEAASYASIHYPGELRKFSRRKKMSLLSSLTSRSVYRAEEPRRGARGYPEEPQEAWPSGAPLRAAGQA